MADEGGDFYGVLGLERTASADAIREAYRERVKETHPDVAEGADAADRFRRVKRAHEVLGDPAERRRYDRLGHEGYLAAERVDADDGREPDSTAPGARARNETGTAPGATAASATDAGGTTRASETRGTRWTRHGRPGYGATTASERTRTDRDRAEDYGTVQRGAARWVRLTTALLEAWQSRLTPASGPLALAVFVAYPVFLGSTVAPWFPLPVNAIVGVCTLFVVAYLVLKPELGIPVFGGWLALLPVALSVAGLGVLSLSGALAFLLTAVPLALCVSALVGGATL
ncbi:DnaJ domain-containing protein [Salinirubellus salinus]|uniref:DnaJ domain-containing protein n=1 Tax=Salinirubellus salinus TaxID=1364945 RepID=A0A9E7UBT3_9EURY|nr:DnaJ domain-containing protein [Salinirubellus salinus]UWM55457.1 DnaJ domain-containing protein [Salinirubellus salinus]